MLKLLTLDPYFSLWTSLGSLTEAVLYSLFFIKPAPFSLDPNMLTSM